MAGLLKIQKAFLNSLKLSNLYFLCKIICKYKMLWVNLKLYFILKKNLRVFINYFCYNFLLFTIHLCITMLFVHYYVIYYSFVYFFTLFVYASLKKKKIQLAQLFNILLPGLTSLLLARVKIHPRRNRIFPKGRNVIMSYKFLMSWVNYIKEKNA